MDRTAGAVSLAGGVPLGVARNAAPDAGYGTPHSGRYLTVTFWSCFSSLKSVFAFVMSHFTASPSLAVS
jgi:hypothetical protein